MRFPFRVIIAFVVVVAFGVGEMSPQSNSGLAAAYVEKLKPTLAMSDQTDYSDEFYKLNYLTTFTARDEMPWGHSIPLRELEHFVLPVRVNNENLDSARVVFYKKLKDRVKGMTMKEAILEVNHWCHEKVSYRPSDARTSCPLATVRTAYGRCGEESTFLVAALRSVCIPARQVYTPRWAHTDDNHAWVEAWADGQWCFLGACEPEPVLNLGWFNEGASRGMLMHTKVAGNYTGPEEVMSRTPCYTEINVTSNYAPTSRVDILVVDAQGKPVPQAMVEFKLYNYAEFYTVAKKTTDENGKTFLTAGHGDLLLWVTKDDLVAVKKVSWTNDHNESIVLKEKSLPQYLALDIVPPPAIAVLPLVSEEQRALNDRRKAHEDSVRQAYESTMPVEAWRGNYRTIQQFLDEAQNKVMAQKLLEVISAKDLRDVTLDVLKDNEVAVTDTSDIYCRYVLCPRVENEWLTPYKAFFRKELSGKITCIDDLIKWTKKHITIDDSHNPQRLRHQPMSVYRTCLTDDLGRAIFFVSAARTLGFPARINEVTGKLEYYAPLDGGAWKEVNFEKSMSQSVTHYGRLKLDFTPSTSHKDLSYYTHFTLSKIENGKPQLLTYPDDATWCSTFAQGVTLEAGTYLLTVGNRQSDGSVLAEMTVFEVNDDEVSYLPLALREKAEVTKILGTIENLSYSANGKRRQLLAGDKYNIIGIIAPSNEPTTHALHDIATCVQELEAEGSHIVLLSQTPQDAERFNMAEFNDLPSSVIWGVDQDEPTLNGVALDGSITASIVQNLNLNQEYLPLFIVTDDKGLVIFAHQGYTIHLGEQMLKVIRKHQQETVGKTP